MRSYSPFLLLVLVIAGVLAEEKPELKNNELLNEGEPGCARFDQQPMYVLFNQFQESSLFSAPSPAVVSPTN